MSYSKTTWVNGTTPLSAANFNNIETAIETLDGLLDGHSVEKNVPSTAVFTDTVYDDTTLTASVNAVSNTVSATTINGNGLGSAITITAASVGLGNCNNTSDLNKPISTATQTALNSKVDKVSGKGLSTNDYTTAEQSKVAIIGNINDWDSGTLISVINDLLERVETLESQIQNE